MEDGGSSGVMFRVWRFVSCLSLVKYVHVFGVLVCVCVCRLEG